MDMEIKRGPGRPPRTPESTDTMRPNLRPDELRASDPQEAARIRAEQIIAQIGDGIDETDEFFVPEELKDPNWDMQWVRYSTYNQEDTNNINRYKRHGWEFVPANRPGFERYVPRGWKETFILKDGMVLMELPMEVSRIIRDKQLHEAKSRVQIAGQRIGQALPAGFTPDNSGREIAVHGVSGARRTISGPIPN